MSVGKQLSMFFRNQRRLSSTTKKNDKNGKQDMVSAGAKKKFKMDDGASTSGVGAKRNLELMKDWKSCDVSEKTFSALMVDTFNKRRQFIKHEAESVKDILQQCPYFEDLKHVSVKITVLIALITL